MPEKVTSFDIAPIYMPSLRYMYWHRSTWAYAREWRALTHHVPTFTLTYHTHEVSPARMWERVFRRPPVDV